MTKGKRAGDETLSEIHDLLARQLLERLKNGDALNAQEINAVRQFLKDNQITAEITPGSIMGDLKRELTDKDKDFFQFGGATQQSVGM